MSIWEKMQLRFNRLDEIKTQRYKQNELSIYVINCETETLNLKKQAFIDIWESL